MKGPIYQHDCTACTYLGTIEFTDTEGHFPHKPSYKGTYDLYYCGGDWSGATVIARWSSDGPDYFSGMTFGKAGTIPPLTAAYAIAVSKGLIE